MYTRIPDLSEFGRTARLLGVSNTDLAEVTGLARETISKYATGYKSPGARNRKRLIAGLRKLGFRGGHARKPSAP